MMNDAPKELNYQGKTLYLAESTVCENVKGNPVRHIFVDRSGTTRFVQCEFEGHPVDWKRLEDENQVTTNTPEPPRGKYGVSTQDRNAYERARYAVLYAKKGRL